MAGVGGRGYIYIKRIRRKLLALCGVVAGGGGMWVKTNILVEYSRVIGNVEQYMLHLEIAARSFAKSEPKC